MLEPHFDRWQFDGRRANVVSARTGIDWPDFQNEMHTGGACGGAGKKQWTPAFAFNDEQVRRVVLYVAARMLQGSRPVVNCNWREVDAACTSKVMRRKLEEVPAHQREQLARLQRAITKAGSYLALLIGVVFHFWRRGQDSVAVAQLLDMTPVQVRQRAFQMVKVAKELGLETHVPHATAGRTFSKKAARARLEARRRALRRRMYGKPEFDERIHCFWCKVARIAPGQKWLCANCAGRRRAQKRAETRKKQAGRLGAKTSTPTSHLYQSGTRYA